MLELANLAQTGPDSNETQVAVRLVQEMAKVDEVGLTREICTLKKGRHTCCNVWVGANMLAASWNGLTASWCRNLLHCCPLEATCVPQVPVLIAIDDYNLLHSHTEFYEAASTFHRRQIPPEEIQLAAALRVLSVGKAPKRCACSVVHPTGCLVGDLQLVSHNFLAARLQGPVHWGCHNRGSRQPQAAAACGGKLADGVPRLLAPRGSGLCKLPHHPGGHAAASASVLRLLQHLQLVTLHDGKPAGFQFLSWHLASQGKRSMSGLGKVSLRPSDPSAFSCRPTSLTWMRSVWSRCTT